MNESSSDNLRKKINYESDFLKSKRKDLELNLSNLKDFIRNRDGPFLEGENYKELRRLEFRFNRSFTIAIKNGIDVSDCENLYNSLEDELEDKNRRYIQEMCNNIFEENCRKRLEINHFPSEEYNVRVIHDPRILGRN
jgi:hypothetical protein